MNWSEPDVPAAYSGVPFLTDDLTVPFFAKEACCMGAHFTAREATIFLEKNVHATCESREVNRVGCDKLRRGRGSGWKAFLEVRG